METKMLRLSNDLINNMDMASNYLNELKTCLINFLLMI